MAFFSPKRPEKSSTGFLFSETSGINLRPVYSFPKRPEQIFGRFSLLRNIRDKSSAGVLFSETSGTNLRSVFSSPNRTGQIFGRFSLLRIVRDKSLAGLLFSETSRTNLQPIQLSSKYVLGTFTGNQSGWSVRLNTHHLCTVGVRNDWSYTSITSEHSGYVNVTLLVDCSTLRSLKCI
jgi:hypothetical protein